MSVVDSSCVFDLGDVAKKSKTLSALSYVATVTDAKDLTLVTSTAELEEKIGSHDNGNHNGNGHEEVESDPEAELEELEAEIASVNQDDKKIFHIFKLARKVLYYLLMNRITVLIIHH